MPPTSTHESLEAWEKELTDRAKALDNDWDDLQQARDSVSQQCDELQKKCTALQLEMHNLVNENFKTEAKWLAREKELLLELMALSTSEAALKTEYQLAVQAGYRPNSNQPGDGARTQ
ncbi:hypothetical protein LTR53_007316 [Teratosphaeriaceae sp. CCFEE 6253]|nr:hypothetical protein LTR53_007316 [Teratosphaeriaceae sp. CCFEE 6253]